MSNPKQPPIDFDQARLDYFAARAPAEPQPWFDPVIPPCPALRAWNEFRVSVESDEAKAELDLYFDEDQGDLVTKEAQAWMTAYQAEKEAQREWQSCRVKQRYVQWPWAWASEVLKANRDYFGS